MNDSDRKAYMLTVFSVYDFSSQPELSDKSRKIKLFFRHYENKCLFFLDQCSMHCSIGQYGSDLSRERDASGRSPAPSTHCLPIEKHVSRLCLVEIRVKVL